MSGSTLLRLLDVQPSQLYICLEKLNQVLKNLDAGFSRAHRPVPVATLNGETIFLDGHTRAYAAFLRGFDKIRAFYEGLEGIDREEYEICVDWCKKAKIYKIADLNGRIIPYRSYKTLWLQKCRKMQLELQGPRSNK